MIKLYYSHCPSCNDKIFHTENLHCVTLFCKQFQIKSYKEWSYHQYFLSFRKNYQPEEQFNLLKIAIINERVGKSFILYGKETRRLDLDCNFVYTESNIKSLLTLL